MEDSVKPPKRFSQTASVLFFMLPLPKSGKRARDDEGDKGRPNPVREDVRERTPKSPKKKAPVRAKVLEGLHGYSGLNKQKKRVCYNYNLPHGCQNTAKKDGKFDACNKGLHHK